MGSHRKPLSARGRLRRRYRPGHAGEYIRPATREIQSGDRIWLVCRVSGRGQERNHDLADQERNLRARAATLGAVVVGVTRHVGPGHDPMWLSAPAAQAKQEGAKLLAETACRFIRSPEFDPRNREARPGKADLEALREATAGVVLVTDADPDATPAENTSYQSRRGQKEKGRRGGRPPKRRWKARRKALAPRAKKMRVAGLPYRRIAQRLNRRKHGFSPVSIMTVFNWINS